MLKYGCFIFVTWACCRPPRSRRSPPSFPKSSVRLIIDGMNNLAEMSVYARYVDGVPAAVYCAREVPLDESLTLGLLSGRRVKLVGPLPEHEALSTCDELSRLLRVPFEPVLPALRQVAVGALRPLSRLLSGPPAIPAFPSPVPYRPSESPRHVLAGPPRIGQLVAPPEVGRLAAAPGAVRLKRW